MSRPRTAAGAAMCVALAFAGCGTTDDDVRRDFDEIAREVGVEPGAYRTDAGGEITAMGGDEARLYVVVGRRLLRVEPSKGEITSRVELPGEAANGRALSPYTSVARDGDRLLVTAEPSDDGSQGEGGTAEITDAAPAEARLVDDGTKAPVGDKVDDSALDAAHDVCGMNENQELPAVAGGGRLFVACLDKTARVLSADGRSEAAPGAKLRQQGPALRFHQGRAYYPEFLPASGSSVLAVGPSGATERISLPAFGTPVYGPMASAGRYLWIADEERGELMRVFPPTAVQRSGGRRL